MSNLPKTQFLIKNHINFTHQFRTYIKNNRIHFPSVLEGDDNDELDEVIDLLEVANHPDSIYNGGHFGVTYDVSQPKREDTGHFYLDYMGGTEILTDRRLTDPNVKKIPENISYDGELSSENYPTPPQSPRKGGKRRKKKTRKKRGGMEAPPTPPRPPKDNDVGTNKYVPGLVGFHPPQQLPHFMLPPPANPEPVTRRRGRRAAAIEMERAPLDMRIPEEERDVRVNTANQRYRRSQRSHLRNFTGDVLESCTGSRCGLGGSRRRKSRKKKKKKTRRRKKMRRKKNRKRRTKKKSRRKKR